ncbi:flavodoxin-dependent (E)-4-hydroxy-3-methylbut-2-enyl-diphosphate synthase [Clostridium kluyveri]|uniref:4-hydroxy-3-methylbut-2-en-1-yl diphosphate synthase (flavodoxin) n=1 Tax=Clostridium kluyveri TaxID=1534 RepID=A0A1L5F7K4_CLOKL|nr:flavodoxin-dependent (E)-4-hydroxy-3-methylbut-2-enyl-diphosphate synthase [Clostridium kluyveri]APM38790.1 4-hydroxy-3-methylbut-2-en-1-yl diphosphate synthase [Clostridium kluyveri]UZQ51108.1 flavodoxin-dependent (E)-4-hydroxy-3-methylbut-2-enyl-diphosphate synthase [Clostridium kluyveri]
MKRANTKEIRVGKVVIGGNAPIAVQSMTNTDTKNTKATIEQIHNLKKAGCDIVRCAVPDMEACDALKTILKEVSIPLVADIHFDYKLAIKSIENGVSALRINPGNIGNIDKVKMVVKSAGERNVPIRIGVNSGSLKKDILNKYGRVCAEALVESALEHVRILEDIGFYNIVISIKSSNVNDMVQSYRQISKLVRYPLHLGVTEAGTLWRGTIKSSVGVGTLLMEGIGDTIRVSLTGNPVEEVRVGREILKACGHLKEGIEFISCPTCGRTKIDLIKIAEEVEKKLSNVDKNIKVAVMGCVVNGPGEAKEADIGIAGGMGEGLIFKKGKILRRVKEENLVDALIEEVKNI